MNKNNMENAAGRSGQSSGLTAAKTATGEKSAEQGSASNGVKSASDKPEKNPSGRNFTDTFKNILSSVLKTDLGLVLKNRNEKSNANKTTSESSKSTSPAPPATKTDEVISEQKDSEAVPNLMTPILTRSSSRTLLNEINGDAKSRRDVAKDETEVSSENKSTDSAPKLAKPNRARKSMPKELRSMLLGESTNKDSQGKQNDRDTSRNSSVANNQREKPNTRRSTRNVYKKNMVQNSTGKKKKKFKGGTYHLAIRPKKPKKKKTTVNNSKPASEDTSIVGNAEDVSMSLSNLDETSEDMSVQIECEVVNDMTETVIEEKPETEKDRDEQEVTECNKEDKSDSKSDAFGSAEIDAQAVVSSNVEDDEIQPLVETSSTKAEEDENVQEKVSLGMQFPEKNEADSSKSFCTSPARNETSAFPIEPGKPKVLILIDDDDDDDDSKNDEKEETEKPRMEMEDQTPDSQLSVAESTEKANSESSEPDPGPMLTSEVEENCTAEVKEAEVHEDELSYDDNAIPSNNEVSEEVHELSAPHDEDRNAPVQAAENGESGSSENLMMENSELGDVDSNITENGESADLMDQLSNSSTVKKNRGQKRNLDEIEEVDLDSGASVCTINGNSPKRAKKAVTASIMPNEAIDELTQVQVEPELLLCTCQEMCTPAPNGSNSKQIYCQAIDSIDDRLVGCCNVVKRPLLNRCSRIIPFMAMCEIHRSRLRAHHCCPGCGIFCTQGLFVKCNDASSKAWHLFHERCCIVSNNQGLCPHCGLASEWIRIRLRISMSKPLIIFPKQQQMEKQPSARMVLVRGNEPQLEPEPEGDLKQYKIPNTTKEISLAGLPIGPDRIQLESMLMNLSIEKPMNLRYTIKSMYNAAKSNDVEKIFHMLAMGFDPNHKFEEHDNETAVHAACAAGHLVMVHVLHQAGAYLDAFDNKLRTPIMLAIENRNLSVLHYLIRASVQLEARGEDGMTVLHLAARAGHLDACRMLIQSGQINANILDDGGWTPVVWASEHRHKEVVRFLLDHGSDPNIRDNEQNIALHWAAFSGGMDVCEMLLNRGCDVCSINEHGDTPLHIAARQDNYECVILFLARGAFIDIRNKENDTPLMCCPDESTQTSMALTMNMKLKRFASFRTTRTEIMLHKDISMGKEQIAIPCVNGVDDESFPTDYLYVTENCETSPMNIDRSIVSLQNCHCTDDCSSVMCSCSALSLKCWYTQDGGLAPDFNLLDPPMIFECNRACRCWKNCNNRVVQHGITVRLELYRTVGKGWGVRTLRDIPRGTFICEYIGELISDSEADHREDDSYLFDLDNRDGETYCIDARYYGNISRFINHLCEPNLVPVKLFVDHQDLRFPRIAFFSSRDIRAYEELGFDYGEKFWIIKYKAFTCMCDSERCKYSADKIQEMLENYMRRQREELEM